MILPLDKYWIGYLKDIDIKTSDWPWTDEYWEHEAKKNIIKVWLEKDGKTPRGFVAYRFIDIREIIEGGRGTIIHILKLVVHPNWQGRGIGTTLLENVEIAAKLQEVNTLAIILHEEDVGGRKWLIKRGFKALKLHKDMFPDYRDGYSFFKVIE